ncbi:MAG TPA: DUF1614 domain-containing protein [Pirellulales bacterium]
MNDFNPRDPLRMLPSQLGWRIRLNALMLVLGLFLLCLTPFIFWNVMSSALERLHIHPAVAALLVPAIVVGGFFNIPMWAIRRDGEAPVYEMTSVGGVWQPLRVESSEPETLVALNVGGCVIPLLLVVWQLIYLLDAPFWVLLTIAAIVAADAAVCYYSAAPEAGVGVAVPGFVPPLIAVVATWILLSGEANHGVRPSAAFIAGVLGPLIGGNLLRLPEMTRSPSRIVSIGGAGTFDGILLSGVLAALLA